MPYDLAAIRRRLKESIGGRDPDEFRPNKAQGTTKERYRFYILGPLASGDILKSGPVTKSMDQFFISHGNHWINDKPYPCPRIWSGNNTVCKICQIGFDLLRDEKNPDARQMIVRQWMPSQYHMVNIYFPPIDPNPEELRNKVKFYNAPKTCFDIWTEALYRDGPGIPEEPEAYGVFYDECAAFLFELQVTLQGKQNSYRTSRFLPNGGVPQPIFKNADQTPNMTALAALLKLRINLWDKIALPDPVAIERLAAQLLDGVESSPGGDAGFVDESVVVEASKPAPVQTVAGADALANEAPIKPAAAKAVAGAAPVQPQTPPVTTPASTPPAPAAQVDEIEALLSQLDS